MEISLKDWSAFRDRLHRLSEKATNEMLAWIQKRGGYAAIPRDELIAYAHALATKYGEASAALSADMYDAIARLSKAAVPDAVVAETATYGEVAKAINGAVKFSEDPEYISSIVGRFVKQTSQDTTLQNAIRDRAEYAWIPSGETCAFCLTLASQDWQPASSKALNGGHAEHIHANCDCAYVIRFNRSTTVEGYEPQKYLSMYQDANTDSKGKVTYVRDENGRLKKHVQSESDARINAMRRMAYAEDRDKGEGTDNSELITV